MTEQYAHYFEGSIEFGAKNPLLIWARKTAGLTAKEAAKQIGVAYQLFVNYENLTNYPSEETQRKICDFYRSKGIFLFEDDVFPGELRYHEKRINMPKNRGPEFVSLSSLDGKLVGNAEEEILEKDNAEQIKANLEQVLSSLYGTDSRLQKIVRLRYGIDNGEWEIGKIREKYEVEEGKEMCYEDIGHHLDISDQMAQYFLKKAERRIKLRALNNKVLRKLLPASVLKDTDAVINLIKSLL